MGCTTRVDESISESETSEGDLHQFIDIEVSRMPTRVRYHINDNFDTAGMVIKGITEDGQKIEIKNYETRNTLFNEEGLETVDIVYGEHKKEIKVRVVKNTTYDYSKATTTQIENIKNNNFTKEQHTYDGYTIPYRKYVPSDSPLDKLPLVIMLHGAGERGNDNHAQLKNSFWQPFTRSDSLFLDSVIIAPQCPVDPSRWVNQPFNIGNFLIEETTESREIKVVLDLIKEMIEDYIDPNRVYVTGISMGGYGTWDLLTRHSEYFAAGLPICGGGDKTKANILANIPILTFHGTADTSVPYSGTLNLYNEIHRQNKGLIEFITFKNANHNIWDKAFNYQKKSGVYYFEEFMFSKTKNI